MCQNKFNLRKWFDLATAPDIEIGLEWYKNAHKFSKILSKAYGLSLRRVAAIISALSPSVSWDMNKRDAREFIANNGAHRCSTYGQNVQKAMRILNGSDPDIEFRSTAQKTLNFYLNILNPLNSEPVTIDRHMLRVIEYDLPSFTTKRYHIIKNQIIELSIEESVLPNQYQAIIWQTYRRIEDIKHHNLFPEPGF